MTIKLARSLLLLEPEPTPLSDFPWDKPVHGWCCNVHRIRGRIGGTDAVYECWRRGNSWYDNAELKNGYRGGKKLYATRREALIALAHELSRVHHEEFDLLDEIAAMT